MNVGYKEESFNKKRKKIKRSVNRLLTGFLLVFVIGYIFFFTSRIWMPAPYEGVEVTPFGTGIEENDRTMTVDNWTYSKKDKMMEITISIEDLSIDGITKYSWGVKTSTETLPVEVVIEEPDFVVLHVSKVPRKWTELALTMNIREQDKNKNSDFKEVKVYTNDKYVNNVDKIEKKSLKEYRKIAIESRIASYQKELSDVKEEKKNLKKQLKTAEEKIKQLNENKKYQTEAEQSETDENINQLNTERDNITRQLEQAEMRIGDLEGRIEIQNNLLKKY